MADRHSDIGGPKVNLDKVKKELTEKEALAKMAEIEKENGGFGNIPANHPSYWDLRKDLQRLQNK